MTREPGEQRKGKGDDCCHLWHTHSVPGPLLGAVHTPPDISLVKAFITPLDLASGRL